MAALTDQLSLACGQVLPNRLMKAALSEGLGTAENAPGVGIERLYRRWGQGGFGLIITGNVMVDRRHLGEPGNVVVEDDRHLDELTRWAKTAQDGGGRIWAQLNHPGRQANPLATRERPVAPSAVGMAVPGLPQPRELADGEIDEIIERFVQAALVTEAAGFDGVQIHGAHGYLVSQFLSPLANTRSDQWGGDLAGRMRFVTEVVRRIRAAVRPSFAVGVKLNSADFQRGGFTEDESRQVIERLSREGIDLFEISGGSYESPAMMGRSDQRSASTKAREAYFLDYARSARQAAGKVPLAVTGGFRSRAAMIEALESGDCDVIGLGRPTAVNPETAEHIILGVSQISAGDVKLGGSTALATRVPQVKMLDGLLDLQWHTDQLHRMGAGDDPDPQRGAWRTGIAIFKRNGLDALRSGRGSYAAATNHKAVRKFRFERVVGRYFANPVVNGLGKLGVRTDFATTLETTGRKSGLARVVPVSASFDGTGAWIISQHGARSGWAINIAADPRVRIRRGDTWHEGTARFVPEDDVIARARSFGTNRLFSALTASTFRALQSDPVSVRIDFT
ncbi:putative oxidoreductase [Gordonia effusa NBRC 100432]|uniref:Putative oxidoreductase n=1 Tax=Gordonia effusa NBRC 100432 TaxID=1077974 RepID=H0R5K9_9ACTN|nr:nitroreductase family deazaflavin-dependent oxidoreductase [Gordonia effusa]GAB20360.1 putative oxidoreductase [Gordonia effusa NBRC 100432]